MLFRSFVFFSLKYIYFQFSIASRSLHIFVCDNSTVWRYTLPSTFSFFLQVQGIFVASQCRTDFTVTIPSNINVNIFTFWFRFCFVRRRKTINKYPLFRKKQHISMHQWPWFDETNLMANDSFRRWLKGNEKAHTHGQQRHSTALAHCSQLDDFVCWNLLSIALLKSGCILVAQMRVHFRPRCEPFGRELNEWRRESECWWL